jgi:hypothetical protein
VSIKSLTKMVMRWMADNIYEGRVDRKVAFLSKWKMMT